MIYPCDSWDAPNSDPFILGHLKVTMLEWAFSLLMQVSLKESRVRSNMLVPQWQISYFMGPARVLNLGLL